MIRPRPVPSVKLTVSVPVELWDEARNLAPELAASHVVQVALATWIETRKDQQ